MTTATFQAGKTYSGRFIGDADAVFQVKIIKRTAKFVTINNPTEPGAVKRCGILCDHEGSEYIRPFGSYSMAPCCKASHLISA